MKKLLFITLTFIMLLVSCKSASPYTSKHFTVTEAIAKPWVANTEGKGSGVTLYFAVDISNVVFNGVYYNDTYGVLKPVEKDGKSYLSAKMAYTFNTLQEVALPETTENAFLFNLKNNQAVLSYTIKGENYYYLVENVVIAAVETP